MAIFHCKPKLCPSIIACGIVIGMFASPAQAGNWIFRRSYYSHEIPQQLQYKYPLPHSRSAYRPAVTGVRPGFAIRGGYRYNRILLRGNGSTDITIIRENWHDFRR